ncbi:MAG: hypothetical protein LBG09_01345, partial [Puniceicoccales bacterium]|nr:hypothetical protein [Puniceicoccales bacterium]
MKEIIVGMRGPDGIRKLSQESVFRAKSDEPVDVRDVEFFQLLFSEQVEGEEKRVLEEKGGGNAFEASGGEGDAEEPELFSENIAKNKEKTEEKSEARVVKTPENIANKLPQVFEKNDKKE